MVYRCLLSVSLLLAAVPAAVAVTDSPATIKTIYVIPSSHWDFGFVDTPNAVKRAIKPHLDAVIAACDADPQFRWTIESVWQLEAWLEQTKDPAQIQHLADLLRKGQIELSAAYGSMHTEFMGTEELNRLVSAGSQIEQRFGVHPKVAMMNDVPGFSMRLPQVLARSDIRYFITGSNTALGGGAALWPGKEPFYWKSPDGSEVFVWQTQGKNGGYTEGMADYYLAPDAEDPYFHTKFYPKEWKGLSNLEIMKRGIDKLVTQYTDAGYRQSAVAVLFMHDAIGPEYETKYLLPSVRAWNASGRSPHIIVATPSEYFAYLQSSAAKSAPSYMGDWSGLWAGVKLNSPAMSADARFLQERLPQAETLWSLLKMQKLAADYPGKEIESDYNDLFEYDEHNGAGQGGWPDVLTKQKVLEQNREYSEWLRSGRSSASGLFASGLARLASVPSHPHDGERTVLVYNPRSWIHSQLVTLPGLQGSWAVRDARTGAVISAQPLASGELCFEARDIPSVGYRTYLLEPAAEHSADSVATNPAMLSSPYFKVELNPATGDVIRITDLRTRRIIVDGNSGGHAGALVLNDSLYHAPAEATHAVLHRERGPVVDQIIISRPGSLWPKTVITLPQDEPFVRFDEILDRNKMPFVAYKQSRDIYSFAFDFSVEGKVQHWVDNGEGLYRFPDDLLPGARRDAVVPRHTLVWGDEAQGGPYQLLLTQKQSFFDRFRKGTSTDGSHATDGALVDAMIKSDQAKTKDTGVTSFETYEPDYPTTYTFSFAITSKAGPVDPLVAERFVAEGDSDAVELPAGHRPSRAAGSFLSLGVPNVIVEALRPSSDGKPDDFLLRLQEVQGKPADVKLTLPLRLLTIAETNLTEDRILKPKVQANAIRLSPHQTLTLRLSVARPAGFAPGENN